MQLIVKTITGEDATVEAEESDTVETVKVKLLQQKGLHLNEDRLIYVEKSTDEGRAVYSVWNINKNEIIDPSVEQNLVFNDHAPTATTKISLTGDSMPYRSGNSGVVKNKNIKIGWLKKRSDWLMQWRDRYVVLQGNVLSFAQSETANAHGKITIADVNLIVSGTTRTIVVTGNDKKQFHFQASTLEEEESWISVIRNCISR